ncbi:hypothetical protein [Spirosoma validum]|uniref:Uncharacterized protein n=1 Tax=Spirosoma validum TaxID=2771355 RepID=A0A927AYB6_9BACT|nr:hypothetical protein [Spirosoma validum]MBD2752024.1 hypothetical protein [Spirosoma validum]
MDNQIFRPTLLDTPVSFFEFDHQRNTFATIPSQRTTLRRMATTRYYQAPIEDIRAETDKTKQDDMKKHLSAFTPVALLKHRKKDTTFAEKILQQWPVMMGDVDQKDNPGVDMAELKKHLTRLPFILICAYSVRGGLWFVVRLPDDQTPETLEAHFRYLQKLFQDKLGIKLDPTKGGNPTHLRFVSCDEEPYLNDNAKVMTGTYTPPPPKPSPAKYTPDSTQDDTQLLHRLVRYTELAGEGERHSRLLKAAKLAGGFVAANRLDEQTAIYALETVVSEWPMFAKSQKTIRDGLRYGMATPVYPEAKYERDNYPQNRSFDAGKVTATAKPPICTLAASSNFPDAENTFEQWFNINSPKEPDELIFEQSSTDDWKSDKSAEFAEYVVIPDNKRNEQIKTRIAFPSAPLAFDADEQCRRILYAVLPVEIESDPNFIVDNLDDWAATPGSILKPAESQIERLTVESCDSYPPEIDEPSPAGTIPLIREIKVIDKQSFFEWQRSKESPFSKLGLASLNSKQQS